MRQVMQQRANKRRRGIRSAAGRVPGACHAVLLLALLAVVGMTCTMPGVARAADVDDDDITNAVETEMLLDQAIETNAVDVSTQEGVVTLSGTVDSILAKERSTRIAEGIVGVRAVVNTVTVEPRGEITDEALQQAVEDALLQDAATESYEVEARATNGHVTLTGTVESWQERKLAATVTKGVNGVRGVTNEISVIYEQDRADYELQTEISARIENDVRVDDLLVTVNVNNGEVTLSGSVGSAAEKRLCRQLAWVAGVESVDASALRVEWWARDTMRRKENYQQRTDEEVEAAVKDAFLYDPRVLSFNPEVDVDFGAVTLSGVVSSLEAKRAAERDARNVTGVRTVTNNLKVRPASIPSDPELEAQVGVALTADPYVERYDISVDATTGWVTLSGEVNTSFEKARAERVAEGVNGVLRVFNNLEYEYEWSWKPDWQIKADVDDQFFWSPFVDGDDVTATVNDGVVTLTGRVATWSERQSAEENAYEGGAKDVENDLIVTYEWYGPYDTRGRYGERYSGAY